MRMVAVVLGLIVLVTAGGCPERTSSGSGDGPKVVRSPRVAAEWTERREYRQGDVIFRHGMTKADILSQLAAKDDPDGFRRPEAETIQQDIWRLSYEMVDGPAARPIIAVRITFRDGVVVKIEEYTGPQPA